MSEIYVVIENCPSSKEDMVLYLDYDEALHVARTMQHLYESKYDTNQLVENTYLSKFKVLTLLEALKFVEDENYKVGYQDAHDHGFNDGYSAGYEEGKTDGYQEGLNSLDE